MCGIVGIFDLHSNSEIDRELLSRMNETQFHRGPDEGGIHVEDGLGFAHRRLSIIDLFFCFCSSQPIKSVASTTLFKIISTSCSLFLIILFITIENLLGS